MALTITFPDGSERNYDSGVTGAEIAASIGPRLAKAAVAIKLDGNAIDLGRPITSGGTVEIHFGDEKTLGVLWMILNERLQAQGTKRRSWKLLSQCSAYDLRPHGLQHLSPFVLLLHPINLKKL